MMLALAAIFGMILALGDVKNAYFNGRQLQREVYLDQPRGGLPSLRPGQLLRAKKAIYGFAEAGRLLWLALLESWRALAGGNPCLRRLSSLYGGTAV